MVAVDWERYVSVLRGSEDSHPRFDILFSSLTLSPLVTDQISSYEETANGRNYEKSLERRSNEKSANKSAREGSRKRQMKKTEEQ